jgi:hypothetical protein
VSGPGLFLSQALRPSFWSRTIHRKKEKIMKRRIILAGVLTMALAAQSVGAKTLEEVLKEKRGYHRS